MCDLKECYRVYNNDVYEVAITSKNVVIHDKLSNKYYGARSDDVPTEIVRLAQERASVFSVRTSLFFTASMVALLIANMMFSVRSNTIATRHFFSLVYTVHAFQRNSSRRSSCRGAPHLRAEGR